MARDEENQTRPRPRLFNDHDEVRVALEKEWRGDPLSDPECAFGVDLARLGQFLMHIDPAYRLVGRDLLHRGLQLQDFEQFRKQERSDRNRGGK